MVEITNRGDIVCLAKATGEEPKVRVEGGPMRLTATATAELLSDAETAKHYQVGNRDALGKPIVLGEEMTYLDWGGTDRAKVLGWYVYQLQLRPVLDDNGAPALDEHGAPQFVEDPNYWVEVGLHASRDDAMAQAAVLASA